MAKNNNTVSQALLDMEKISNAIKEESKNTLRDMLSEAVKNAIRESVEEEDDDMEITDSETQDDSEDNTVEQETDNTEDQENADGQESTEDQNSYEDTEDGDDSDSVEDTEDEKGKETGAEDDSDDSDDWSDISKYKVDDDTYDLRDVKDYDELVKVYKRLKSDNENNEVVVKNEKGKVELKDNSTGAEYIIDLGNCDDEETVNESEETEEDLLVDDDSIAGLPSDDMEDFVGDDFNDEIDNEIEADDSMEEPIFEIDLGYTDSYQSKDPISNLSNEEPGKNVNSWHKGIPTGTSKPWVGKTSGKGTPFSKNTTVDEGTNVTMPNSRKKVKSHTPDTEKKNYPQVHHHDSVAGEYKAIKENVYLKNQIRDLKEMIGKLKNHLDEAYMTNVNLGKITKLFLENATTKEEKINIVNRFSNEAKTVDDSKKLYESISKELSERKTPIKQITESKTVVSEQKKPLLESKSKDLMETIDLMNRVMNI